MEIMPKYAIALSFCLMSLMAMAGRCKLCGARIMESRDGFCASCKYRPEAKKMQKEEKEKKIKEKQNAELLAEQKKPLKLKSFLGFEFLAKATGNERIASVKLKKPFREFSEAQLGYTSLNRLYSVSITNTFEKFSCADVENEVTAIAHILEKKYAFTFPNGVVCNEGRRMIGGGRIPGARSAAPIRILDFKRTTYFAKREWSDVTIEVVGIFYRDSDEWEKKLPSVCVTVSMPEIFKKDSESRKALSASDENGIDVL